MLRSLDHGVDVNEQNKFSQGPLYAASLVGNVPAVKLLLGHNADIKDDGEVFDRTAEACAFPVPILCSPRQKGGTRWPRRLVLDNLYLYRRMAEILICSIQFLQSAY